VALGAAVALGVAYYKRGALFQLALAPGSGNMAPPVQASSSGIPMRDDEPGQPPCAFWEPWKRLVAPDEPRDYLQRVKSLMGSRAERTERFFELISRGHGVTSGQSERLCILGRFDAQGKYALHGEDAKECAGVPPSFFDINLEMGVERLPSGAFINSIHLAVGTGAIGPEAFVRFAKDQIALMRGGYKGWSKAFPRYFELNRSGLGWYVAKTRPEMELRVGFLSQPMMGWVPAWGEYLLRLSDLVTVTSSISEGLDKKLLGARSDTVVSRLELSILDDGVKMLDALRPHELHVAHDVIVRFRGLQILVNGMRFAGDVTPLADTIRYAGKFRGIKDFVLEGAYRGVGLGGDFGKMIKEVVDEAVQREVKRLVEGNHGKGWTFDLALDSSRGKNVFVYDTEFESPVNFVNLLRENKDETGNPVLPDKSSLTELNRWSVSSVDAVLADLEQHKDCAGTAL
jgi:hypothetical protein